MRCLALGADVVIYSATKHVDGQGRCLGGIVLGSRDFIRGTLEPFLKHTGGALSPFNAWVMLKGMETLDLRCRAQAETAAHLAGALQGHSGARQRDLSRSARTTRRPSLRRGRWRPAAPCSRSISPAARTAAFRFLDALEIVLISNNLGDTKSLVTHPATTTHQRLTAEQRAALGIGDGLVRLSVGLEDPADLLADLRAALDRA